MIISCLLYITLKLEEIIIDFAAKYLFIETSSPRQPGDIAKLQSTASFSGAICFAFWYHMLGSSIGKLDVYIKNEIGVKQLQWTLSGNQGTSWHKAEVNLGSNDNNYTVSNAKF